MLLSKVNHRFLEIGDPKSQAFAYIHSRKVVSPAREIMRVRSGLMGLNIAVSRVYGVILDRFFFFWWTDDIGFRRRRTLRISHTFTIIISAWSIYVHSYTSSLSSSRISHEIYSSKAIWFMIMEDSVNLFHPASSDWCCSFRSRRWRRWRLLYRTLPLLHLPKTPDLIERSNGSVVSYHS